MTHIDTPARPVGPRGGPRETVDALLHRRAALPPSHPDRDRLRHRAVELGLPVARSLARRYARRGESIADVQQVASLGLVKAVNRFDPAKGSPFWAYATPTITGEIKRHFRENDWAVEVPRRYQELQQRVHQCREGLAQHLRRQPEVADLADHLCEKPGDIIQALLAENGRWAVPLSALLRTRDRFAGWESDGADERGFELVETHDLLHTALARLPHRDQRIIALRFFGDMTQSEIGAELGMSQMHVSRILARILVRLRWVLRDKA